VVVNLQASVVPTGRTEYKDGFYVEMLTDERTGEPYYRSCTLGGGTCRYSADLWQAELYVQHLRGLQG
jgi:hypothetical protein